MSEDAGGRYHNHVDGVAVPSRALRAQGRRGDHLRRAVTVTQDGEAATVYADDRLTTVVASPTTDEDGRYSFYVGEGTFEVTVADTDTATSPMPVEWRAAAAPPGGAGVASLADLEDVDLTGAAEGDVLTIDSEGLVVPGQPGTSERVSRKTADESVISSTTLQDDDELHVAVDADEIYLFDAVVFYEGATSGDIKSAFTVPAGATLLWGQQGLSASATSATNSLRVDAIGTSGGSGGAVGTAGAGTALLYRVSGIVVVGATAGTLQYQWAQVASDATATKVLANSYLTARPVGN